MKLPLVVPHNQCLKAKFSLELHSGSRCWQKRTRRQTINRVPIVIYQCKILRVEMCCLFELWIWPFIHFMLIKYRLIYPLFIFTHEIRPQVDIVRTDPTDAKPHDNSACLHATCYFFKHVCQTINRARYTWKAKSRCSSLRQNILT